MIEHGIEMLNGNLKSKLMHYNGKEKELPNT